MPSDAAAQDPSPADADAAPGAGPSDHDHGPSPSFEWILDGKRDTVLPHLKTIAPTLQWQDQHFHVRDVEPRAEDWPELFQIELDELPVGALDFMSLPGDRTLMRLYLLLRPGHRLPTRERQRRDPGLRHRLARPPRQARLPDQQRARRRPAAPRLPAPAPHRRLARRSPGPLRPSGRPAGSRPASCARGGARRARTGTPPPGCARTARPPAAGSRSLPPRSGPAPPARAPGPGPR